MKTIGFPISHLENERRRALLPAHVAGLACANALFFEEGYGHVLGIADEEYREAGARVQSRGDVFAHPILCNPKAPTPDEAALLQEGQTYFGWIHAVQGRQIVDLLLARSMTAIAWEDMHEGGRHSFWRNNELSGEAAILHSFLIYGRPAYECEVALIGKGNVARGALRVLEKMGASVTVYDRRTIGLLRSELGRYDVIVNGILWDVFRTDHLVYRSDLCRMRPGSMIVDISCDDHMGIETCRATTIDDPVYLEECVLHYAVTHTSALLYKAASRAISEVVCRFVEGLVSGVGDPILRQATIIENGVIRDERIMRFQGR